MKILHFEYFIAVVEHNSFTRAAEYLHIAQPSLTQAIKKLEQELGYTLLTRSTKDIKITEKGILFYQYAKDIVKNYHLTVEKMYDLNYTEEPKIKLSILESTSQWVSTVVMQHHKLYENQRYLIKEILDYDQFLQALLKYDIDIVLSNEYVNHSDIVSTEIYNEEYVLLTPKDAFNTPSTEIVDLPLILPNQTYQVRKHFDDYCSTHGIHPNIILEVDRFEAACNFVREGLGFAIIPKIYYQSIHTEYLSTVKIEPQLSRTIYMNLNKKRKHSDRVLSLLDLFKSYWHFDS